MPELADSDSYVNEYLVHSIDEKVVCHAYRCPSCGRLDVEVL